MVSSIFIKAEFYKNDIYSLLFLQVEKQVLLNIKFTNMIYLIAL